MNNVGEIISPEQAMCREFCPNVLMQQLKVNVRKFWCWGGHAFCFDTKTNKLFRFAVSGRKHTGHVYIFLNGIDLYDIYLTSQNGTIKEVINDVYGEDICEIIDNHIEKIPAYAF